MNFAISHLSATYKVSSNALWNYLNPPGHAATTTENRIFPSVGYYEQFSYFITEPTHVIDNIYLGSAHNAANFTLLQSLGISIIINITHNPDHFPEYFTYKHYGLNDNNEDDIEPFLDEIYNFLESHPADKVLIHCQMGASRSPTVVIYYLMKKHKMSYENALLFVKEKRSIVNLNLKFAGTLMYYERKLRG